MISDRLLDLMTGWVEFRARGEQPQRIINLALTRGISLWSIRQASNTIVARVRPDQFAALHELATTARVKIRVLRRGGLPAAARKARTWGLFAAVLSLLLAMGVYLTTFIWFIEVSGTDQLPQIAILSIADECGLRPGVRGATVDKERVRRTLIAADDLIAWASVSISATKARIEIVERTPETAHRWLTLPGDIVAAESSYIDQVIVISGEPKVRSGDVVARGDVIIAGTPHQPRARGLVRAVVWYEGYGEGKTAVTEAVATGQSMIRVLLKIGGREIILRGPSIPYKGYEVSAESLSLLAWRNQKLTVEVIRQHVREVSVERRYVSEYEAEQVAVRRAIAAAYRYVPETVRVVDTELKGIAVTADTIGVRAVITTRGDIGRFVPAGDVSPGSDR